MNDKIKETIFMETIKTYDHECYSREDLEGFIADLDTEIELALDCYYRFDDEEMDQELIKLAWDNYDTIRQYNRVVIDAIKAVLRARDAMNEVSVEFYNPFTRKTTIYRGGEV